MRNKERFRGLKGKPGKDVLDSLGGGASTWADLGEKTENVTLTFDGNTDGLETVVVDDNFSLVKISDDIPAKENMIGAVLTTPDGSITVTESGIFEQSGAYVVAELMMVVSDYTLVQSVFPVSSNGIWLVKSGETYLTKIEYTSTVYTPIPKQYLPEDIGGGGGVVRVLVTAEETEAGDIVYSASHTYEKIVEAFAAGKCVECVLGDYVMQMSYLTGASGMTTYGAAGRDAVFSSIDINNELNIVMINEKNKVDYYNYSLTIS